MKNKKAYLRIVEAFIAILLISGVLLFVVRNDSTVSSEDISTKIKRLEITILQAVAENSTFRSQILNDQISNELNNFVRDKKPINYEFQLAVCGLVVACPLPSNVQYPVDREIYSEAVAITTNITSYQPKQLKIFMWKK